MNNGNFFNFNAPGYHHYQPFGSRQQPRQVANVEVGNRVLAAGSGHNLPQTQAPYAGPTYEAGQSELPGIVTDVDDEPPTRKQRPMTDDAQSVKSALLLKCLCFVPILKK